MGCFSWIAQDTNRQIVMNDYYNKKSENSKPRTYYMWDNNGNMWKQEGYEGYGIFGGKDYYILLAEMNQNYIGYSADISNDSKRNHGIDLEFGHNNNNTVLSYPNLTETANWKWVNQQPSRDEYQGCEYNDEEEEEEDDDEEETQAGKYKNYCGSSGEMESVHLVYESDGVVEHNKVKKIKNTFDAHSKAEDDYNFWIGVRDDVLEQCAFFEKEKVNTWAALQKEITTK